MQDLNDFYYFVQVVDHGGFAPAGRALGLQKSKLSRRLQNLEDSLGVRLLNRSSRRFSVTEVGRLFYERCVAMLVEAEAAEHVIAQISAEPRGVIRVACPVALVQFQFGAMIARFMAEYPAVEVHLESVNRRVDVLAEGFDLAIRVRFPPIEPSELIMRQLDMSTQCLVASSALVAAPPAAPPDLASWPSLSLGAPHGRYEWALERSDGQTAVVPHRPRLVTDDMAALREAAIAGVGVAQLPTMMIWNDVAEGRLVHVLSDWRPRPGVIHAVFPSRRGLLPSVRALLDHLAAACAEQRRDITME